MNARTIFASVVSTAVLATPACTALWVESHSALPDPSDSWQRGMVVLPVLLLAATLACSSVGRWLLVNGHTSLFAFSSRAVAAASVLWFALGLPSALVIIYLEIVSLGEALLAALLLGAVFIASVAPATIAWWLIAVRSKPQTYEKAA